MTTNPAEEFRARLQDDRIKPIDIAGFLDALAPADRVLAIRGIGRAEQRRLWNAVENHASIRLSDLVPSSQPDHATVRHFGKNSLPAFTHFEKRFTRAPGQDPHAPVELSGFNFQTLSPLTGPGYFVAVDAPGGQEVTIDYRRVPEARPEGWPEIRSNDRGVSRLVYGSMVDTLRRVSEHVSIGSAAKNGKDLGSWFILCREG